MGSDASPVAADSATPPRAAAAAETGVGGEGPRRAGAQVEMVDRTTFV